jgi:hypothetical protein
MYFLHVRFLHTTPKRACALHFEILVFYIPIRKAEVDEDDTTWPKVAGQASEAAAAGSEGPLAIRGSLEYR